MISALAAFYDETPFSLVDREVAASVRKCSLVLPDQKLSEQNITYRLLVRFVVS